ncbi:MAG: tetratricopeptide repeat protein [Candidatus Poseidoniaceae archaeon]|nr:tetratricopeptide repeat protein [Candidatus Poseidoniaceae archaeon]
MKRVNYTRFLYLFSLIGIIALPSVQAATIANPSDIQMRYLFPALIAFTIAIPVWVWFIPKQLSNLQVAFETDDDLYEVHRITNGLPDARELLRDRSVSIGVGLYMMGMTGVLLLITELLFNAEVYYGPNLFLIGVLIAIPVIISPWETLNAQLIGKRKKSAIKSRILRRGFRRVLTLGVLIAATIGTTIFGIQTEGAITAVWIAAAMLTFMAPTIIAYGRIMGASWNMLLINKWRTANGRPNPIDPDKAGLVSRLFSLILVIFLATMPITALNGIVTVFYILVNEPDNATEILNYGGIIGHSIYVRIDLISDLLFHWQFIKAMPQFLSVYLTMNIAIVGLAFIFELTRNLVLGGQSFGGLFGVTLDTPREIRTEKSAQARQLTFAFAGFSGYTVFLLVLVSYKEFGALMPFTDWLESEGFNEGMRLLTTWMFIAVGQAIFLLTWLLSIIKFSQLSNLRFDLNPDERRDGAVKLEGGGWMRQAVEVAARGEDLDSLIAFQRRSISEDAAIVRHEKARAKMWEMAIRGLWPSAIEEARKVLAQSGGNDDEARMIVATGQIASRRLDAAREALHGLQQPEGYDEPELLAFICEWMDPWQGTVTEDDIWDWENNSCIDHLQMLMSMLRGWKANPPTNNVHNDRLFRVAQLSIVALLRAQRQHDDALELALQLVKEEPVSVRPRIAAALCLIDKGDWHSARSIMVELMDSDPHDPRVLALSYILGQPQDEEELEVALVNADKNIMKKFINEAPVNSVAALSVKGGMDEAINANVLIASHEAVKRGMTPRYSSGVLSIIMHYFVLIPSWLIAGIYVSSLRGEAQGVAVVVALLFSHFGFRRFSKQQRRVIRHRDQRAMVAYAKRMKRNKVIPSKGNLPIGTHLLLSGILVTVNGVVLDVGMPGWLTVRLPKDTEKVVRSKLKRQANIINKSRPPRLQPLGEGWWLKRPKEDGAEIPALERLIGPAAYRGRQQYVERKKGKASRPRGRVSGNPKPVSRVDLNRSEIPSNTIISERKSKRSFSSEPISRIGTLKPTEGIIPQRKNVENDSDDDISFL